MRLNLIIVIIIVIRIVPLSYSQFSAFVYTLAPQISGSDITCQSNYILAGYTNGTFVCVAAETASQQDLLIIELEQDTSMHHTDYKHVSDIPINVESLHNLRVLPPIITAQIILDEIPQLNKTVPFKLIYAPSSFLHPNVTQSIILLEKYFEQNPNEIPN